MKPFTIIISTFNEEDTIEECLSLISKVCSAAEIILIHGGRDRTDEVAKKWARERSHPIRVIKNFGDCGKGHAIKLGISLARYPVMLQFDADLQFAPEDIPRVVEPLMKSEADLVIGSRFMASVDKSGYQSSFFRDIGNTFLNRYISLLAGQKISDVTTGMKAWLKRSIWSVQFKDNRFVYEMEIVLRSARKGFRIIQIPVAYASRKGGASGHGTGLGELCSIARTGFMIAFRALLIRLKLW